MYLSVTAIVLGEVVLTRSTALAIYWAVWFACVNVFVISYEEPTLRRQFGASYDEYVSRVGRWVPLPRTPTTETRRSLRTLGDFVSWIENYRWSLRHFSMTAV